MCLLEKDEIEGGGGKTVLITLYGTQTKLELQSDPKIYLQLYL